jgi:inosine-uridine nucleoside N-ribohydrolase
MTNLATLLLKYPEVKTRIERLVLMAGTGSAAGNTSPVAEFNVRVDPEASDIVLRSEVPITLYTLDVFRGAMVTRDAITRLREADNPSAGLAAEILKALTRVFDRDTTFIGDAGVVAAVIEPKCLTTESFPTCVELDGTFTRGQTVIDRRIPVVARLNASWATPPAPRVDVTVASDAARLTTVFLDLLSAGTLRGRAGAVVDSAEAEVKS